MLGHVLPQIFEIVAGHAWNVVVVAADAQFCVHLLAPPRQQAWAKFRRSGDFVDRNDNHTTQRAAEEGGDPLRAVLPPEQDFVVVSDTATFEFQGKAVGAGEDVAVAPVLYPAATAMDVSRLLAWRRKLSRYSSMVVRASGQQSNVSCCESVEIGSACRPMLYRLRPSGGSRAPATSACCEQSCRLPDFRHSQFAEQLFAVAPRLYDAGGLENRKMLGKVGLGNGSENPVTVPIAHAIRFFGHSD